MTIYFEKEVEENFPFDWETVLSAVIRQAVEVAGCPYEIEVNVTLTDNAAIQEMNREFRNIDSPTDVLSFPMVDYEAPSDFTLCELSDEYFEPDSGELLLGDIVLSLDKIKEQAVAYGHSEKREIAFLTAHSMLHLFGYDHMTKEGSQKMEEKQEQICQAVGIPRE